MFNKKEEYKGHVLNELDIIQIIKNVSLMPNHQHCSKCGRVVIKKDYYTHDKEGQIVCQDCIIEAGFKAIKKQ